jgi:hypothetical protein
MPLLQQQVNGASLTAPAHTLDRGASVRGSKVFKYAATLPAVLEVSPGCGRPGMPVLSSFRRRLSFRLRLTHLRLNFRLNVTLCR